MELNQKNKEEKNMTVNNANNPNYVPQYVTWRGETNRNYNGLNQQEITERQLRREVFSRVNQGNVLGQAHLQEVQRITGGQSSSMTSGIQTQHSEAIRNQTANVIRELMAGEEEGSLRMSVLQRMLEDSMRPPTNEILSDPSVQTHANNRNWWA
ncbi:MAG: hypothetical protein FWB91_10700 [Defluviitaleaceae bacterium]|nr:hypothetical protein [Defluviitaleaceae bacterium]